MRLDNNGECCTPEVKKAYRKLALKWHPDKAPDTADMDKVRARFENLVKAYETLSNQEKFDNWVKYGNPEGSLATKALEIALPDILSGEKMILFVFITIIVMILGILTWMRGKSMYLDNGIKIQSKEAIKNFMFAILADNDK